MPSGEMTAVQVVQAVADSLNQGLEGESLPASSYVNTVFYPSKGDDVPPSEQHEFCQALLVTILFQ